MKHDHVMPKCLNHIKCHLDNIPHPKDWLQLLFGEEVTDLYKSFVKELLQLPLLQLSWFLLRWLGRDHCVYLWSGYMGINSYRI